MAKIPRKKANLTQDAGILGSTPVLTVQQRQALEKQKKAEEKALRKQLRAQQRAHKVKDTKQMAYVVSAMIAVMVAVTLLLVFIQTKGMGMQPKEDATYFLDNALVAEMGDEGVQAAINEVYYTRNGGLRINMNFANAEPTTQHPVSVYVKLMNDAGEIIAQGTVTDVRDDFYIVTQGYASYELFIPAKFVQIADDPLSKIGYEITVETEEYKK